MGGFSHVGIVSCGAFLFLFLFFLFSHVAHMMWGVSHGGLFSFFFFTIVMSLRRGGAGRVSARSSRDELDVKIAISGSLS